MSTLAYRAALLAAFVVPACAPVAEPLVAPVPQGPAGDSAPRPLVRPVQPTPEFQQALQRGTRSATGRPGERYWQQRVRYSIEAELDPAIPRLTGRERIVYHNRSPDALRFVVLNLYQNLFRVGSFNTGGLTLSRVAAQGQAVPALTAAQREAILAGGAITSGYWVNGTLGRLYLPRPLATGDSAVFEIDWHFNVPPNGAPRTAFEDALGGRVLQVAQWYPQIAVYDDVVGMDITAYSGNGEFYLDYGDFDFALTLPAGWLVAGTGTLQNAEQVLTPLVRQRLDEAARTDSVVRVVTAAELGQGTVAGQNGKVTWRFSARDVRDVAFATSNRYLWDATRATIPAAGGGTRSVAVHAFYRPGSGHWDKGARYTDHSVEYFSRAIVPYQYPQITSSEGPVYGMEYPMLVFVGRPQDPAELALYEVVSHEVGHEWFPMMVGQDEAAFAWMDEGLTTYHESLAANDYFRGHDHFRNPRNAYLQAAGNKMEAPLMRHADLLGDMQLGVAGYYKPGILLRSLRATLGEQVFDQAMRTYANEWNGKHPYAWDFFNTFERVAGRDLDWFWSPWFHTTATHDLAVASVVPGSSTVTVTVRDLGQAPGPAFVVVTASGGTARATVTMDTWLGPPSRRSATLTIPVSGTVTRVEIDPEQFYPDINRRNNVWTP